MARQAQKGASLRPSDMVSGGLIDDVNVTFETLRFVQYDYNGKFPAELFVHGHLVDENGIAYEQYWSAGSLKYFVPSGDGSKAIPVGDKESLNNNTNFAMLMESLYNAGLDDDHMGEEISALDGLEAHIKRVPQPKRTGLKVEPGQEGRDKTVLIVDEVHKWPWEAKAKKAGAGAGKAGAKATTTTATTKAAKGGKANGAAANEDLDTEATTALLGLLEDGPVERKKLVAKLFTALKGKENSNAILKLITSDDFLEQDGAPWSVEEGVISLSE